MTWEEANEYYVTYAMHLRDSDWMKLAPLFHDIHEKQPIDAGDRSFEEKIEIIKKYIESLSEIEQLLIPE